MKLKSILVVLLEIISGTPNTSTTIANNKTLLSAIIITAFDSHTKPASLWKTEAIN
jgi:hypothetical protein|tara:strand:+ start:1133 stop:1300 length:168 start_codon:yes stop_codon:yes gene_type:complete